MTTRHSRREFLKVSGAGMVVGAGLSGGRAHAQARTGTLKVATIVSLSGNFAAYGENLKRGVELYSEQVNERGGVKIANTTYKLAPTFYDDKTDATTAGRLLERAVTTDGSQLALVGLGSVIVKAAIPVAQRLRFPMMTLWATVDGVFAGQKGDPWLFSISNGFSSWYGLTMDMLPKLPEPTIKTVGVISPNDELGVFMHREYLPADLKRTGLTLAAAEFFPAKTQEYAPALARINRTKPDAIIINAYAPDIPGIFKELQTTDSLPAAVVLETQTKAYENIGPTVNGSLVPIAWDASINVGKDPIIGNSSDFAKLYKAKFKEDIGDFVPALGAADVSTYLQVLQRAGTVDDLPKIQKAFRAFEGETFYGAVGFNDIGLNPKAVMYPGQFQNGKVVPVYPPNLATAKPVHPFPLWQGRKR